MEVSVYNIKGEDTGRKLDLIDSIYGVPFKEHVLWLDVKQYLANQRQGTHKAKEKSEVSGSTRKLKRQKGTGGARAGSIKNPLYKGGARIFGPKPRDYSFKLNKKQKKVARTIALSFLAMENNIRIIEDFTIDEPKTKTYKDFLKSHNFDNCKTMFVLPSVSSNIIKSARNIPNTLVSTVDDLNTYKLLNTNKLLISESSIPLIEKNFNI